MSFVAFSSPWASGNDLGNKIGDNANTEHHAYSFMVGVAGCTLDTITVSIRKQGTPADLEAYVFGQLLDDENKPDSTAMTSPITLTAGDMTSSSFEDVSFDFSGEGLALQHNHKYFLVLKNTGSADGGNYWVGEDSAKYDLYQLGKNGGSATYVTCTTSDPVSWSNAPNSVILMKVAVDHSTTRVLFSNPNNGANLDGNNYVEWNYDVAANWQMAQVIETPDDGVYRRIEDVQAILRKRQTAAAYYPLWCHIYENSGDSTNPEVGDLIQNGVATINTACTYVDTANIRITPPVTFRFANADDATKRPVLEPNKSYIFTFSCPGPTANARYWSYYETGSPIPESGGLWYIDQDWAMTSYGAGYDLAHFYVHGSEHGSNPLAAKDELIVAGGAYPIPESTVARIGYTVTPQYTYRAYAFRPSVDCKLDEIRLSMQVYEDPAPLKCKIRAADGSHEISTVLLDLGTVADTTLGSDYYAPQWTSELVIDCGGTLSLTAGTKYFVELYVESTTVDKYWQIWDGDLNGLMQLGTPDIEPPLATRSTAYSSDGSAWTYNTYSCAMHITGISDDDVITLMNIGDHREGPATSNYGMFFEDATDRYGLQKIKTPAAEVEGYKFEIHSIMFENTQYSSHWPYDDTVEVLIKSRSGDSIGATIVNGSAELNANCGFGSSPLDHTAFVNAVFADPKPQLTADTEYWIFFDSDWTNVADEYRIHYARYGKDPAGVGIAGGAYVSTDAFSLTQKHAYGNYFILINGKEVSPPLPPDVTWTMPFGLMTSYRDDFQLRNVITEVKVDDDDVLKYHLTTEASILRELLYKIYVSFDTELVWKSPIPPDTSWVIPIPLTAHIDEAPWTLPYGISVSSDVGLPWPLTSIVGPPQPFTEINWHLTTQLDLERQLLWKILTSADVAIPWHVTETVYKDGALVWPLTTRFSDDSALRWRLLMSADWTTPWHLFHYIEKSFGLRIPIMVEVYRELSWKMMGYQDALFRLRWDIEAKIWQDYQLKYNLTVSSQATIVNNLNDVLARLYRIKWEIDNKIHQDFQVRYNITIENNTVLVIPMQDTVYRDFSLAYSLTGGVQKDTVLRFNLLEYNPVDAETTLRNSLLGKPRFYKIVFS